MITNRLVAQLSSAYKFCRRESEPYNLRGSQLSISDCEPLKDLLCLHGQIAHCVAPCFLISEVCLLHANGVEMSF